MGIELTPTEAWEVIADPGRPANDRRVDDLTRCAVVVDDPAERLLSWGNAWIPPKPAQ
jgi:hypothetical protein